MGLKDMVGAAIAKTEGLQGIAKTKAFEYLDDYKRAVAVLETLGFTVGKLMIGMGILPEIHTSISGSIQVISEDRVNKLIEQHKEEKMLVSLLEALIMTRKLWEHVESKLTSVTLNVTLGVPPKLTVELH